jgi:L-seryl-tRNA(Ser) seleniumtransferase
LAAAIGGGAEVVRCSGKVGGGALPLLELDGYAVALPGEPMSLAGRLRMGDPPVICRIRDESALLDVRAVDESELDALSTAARAALGPPA